MIEIGKSRTVIVKKRKPGTKKLVPVFDEHSQPVTKLVSDEVWRVTRDVLGGSYGPDKHRKLVVGFVNGDLLALRPQGTRQVVHLELKQVYGWALKRKAATALLEKARKKKAEKDAARERREWKKRFK